MVLQMIMTFAVIVFLTLLAAGHQLGLHVGLWFTLGALVASPFLSAVVVLGLAWLAGCSDRRARARRIARAKALK